MFMRDEEGFSLIETLVVIAITGILTAMAIGYTRGNEGRIALIAEQAKLQGMLQKAKALVLQGYERKGGESDLGVCYGVFFDFPAGGAHSLKLFRESVELRENGEMFCPTFDAHSPSNLRENIEVQPIDPRIQGNSEGVHEISFKSPDLMVFANGEELVGSKNIHLQVLGDLSKEAVITIGSGGSVTVRK
ncbi:MAG: type II secretion system protein [bacterium]|nr:type II secretion system protein [bacterium]